MQSVNRDKLACVICLKAEYMGLKKPIGCTGNPHTNPDNGVYMDCYELAAADRVIEYLRQQGAE